jgi:hypothetical protein
MLEAQGALATWQLPDSAMSIGQGGQVACVKLPDHRLAYLTCEGPVSGNRGTVRAMDRGDYELLERSDDRWRVRLRGQSMRGEFELLRQAGGAWLLRRV